MKTMRCKKLSVLKIIAHVGFDENWREGVFEIISMEGFLRLMSELHDDGDSNVDSINNHDSNYIIDGDDIDVDDINEDEDCDGSKVSDGNLRQKLVWKENKVVSKNLEKAYNIQLALGRHSLLVAGHISDESLSTDKYSIGVTHLENTELTCSRLSEHCTRPQRRWLINDYSVAGADDGDDNIDDDDDDRDEDDDNGEDDNRDDDGESGEDGIHEEDDDCDEDDDGVDGAMVKVISAKREKSMDVYRRELYTVQRESL